MGLLLSLVGLCYIYATPLDDYVNAPDPNFAWFDTGLVVQGSGWTGHIINMTSQAWLTAADWSFAYGAPGPLWWHWMLIVIPDKLNSSYLDHGFLWITGGGNDPNGPPTSPTDEDAIVISTLCVELGVYGAALYQVPNEDLIFLAEQPPQPRGEDALIAWAWNHFINDPSDPTWLPRLPMTKAAVRAMDTLSEFIVNKTHGPEVDQFMIAGASKRGWTTWTTAAVDKRVVAMMPVVMDELDFIPNIHHHYRAYCGWSFALEDYYALNFTEKIDLPNTALMMSIIDPLVYADRLTMPKLVVDAGGDEFFLPDDNLWWWQNMSDPKHLLMIANAEHSLATGIIPALDSASAFMRGFLEKISPPVFSWGIDPNTGDITVTNPVGQMMPREVVMWSAESAKGTGRRDFRLVAGPQPHFQPVIWFPTDLQVQNGNTWIAKTPQVPTGRWVAFFVSVKYPGPGKLDYHFTSQVSIWPQTFPCADCYGEDCRGTLT